MAYLEIVGLPIEADDGGFGPTINVSLEKQRGLSVLSADGYIPGLLFDALTGRGYFNGEILLNEKRIDPIPPRARSIGILGETPGIIPNISVKKNLESALGDRILSDPSSGFIIDRELSEGPLATLDDVPASDLDSTERTHLAVTRMLLSGCDLLLIIQLPCPGFTESENGTGWKPGGQFDALLDFKGILRRFRSTWVNFLTDSACVHVLSDKVVMFSEKRLLQEGSLRECINAPVHKTVADFMAFPRINYRTVSVERDGPFVMLRSGRYGFRVGDFIKRQLDAKVGSELLLGLRPEDLGIRPYETGDPTILNLARVMRVDAIPGSLVVYLDMEGSEWVSLTEPNKVLFTGQLVELRPDPDRIHLFHPSHGGSILD